MTVEILQILQITSYTNDEHIRGYIHSHTYKVVIHTSSQQTSTKETSTNLHGWLKFKSIYTLLNMHFHIYTYSER